MVVRDFPWHHAVIDDLIDPAFRDRLAVFSDQAQAVEKFGLYHFDRPAFDAEIQRLFVNYRTRLQTLLPDILSWFPTYRDHAQLDFTSHLAVQPRGYRFKPHCDHPDKIISCISYIAPEHSQGTCLHAAETDGSFGMIDWLPGRTLIFAGRDDVTWHSYSSGPNYRATLCSFFIRPGPDPSR